jgi:hypothetical protein
MNTYAKYAEVLVSKGVKKKKLKLEAENYFAPIF